jgi:hypothetical protein
MWVLQYVMSWYARYNTFELQFIIGACRYSTKIDMLVIQFGGDQKRKMKKFSKNFCVVQEDLKGKVYLGKNIQCHAGVTI